MKSRRYIPLSLVFDGYSNQPTLNYFKIKQATASIFAGYAQISTDVPYGDTPEIVECNNMDELKEIDWRSYAN